jgi:elongation factor P--beta-lysine ligase
MKISAHPGNVSRYKTALGVTRAVRAYLDARGYLELDLPVLSPSLIPEGYLEVFETEFRYMDTREKLYLTPSPELFIKRLLAGRGNGTEGIGNCYYLGKSFRNSEPNSPKHFPEFTMLEFYKVGASYEDIAAEVLGLLRSICKSVYGTEERFEYGGTKISLERWEEMTIVECFEHYAGIDGDTLFDHDAFARSAAEKGYVTEGYGYEELFSQIYAQEIEPHLGKNGFPTILYDYPKEFAALSKPNPDGKTAQRFEFYIDGVELGNCYSELTDWKEQETRFANERKARKESGKTDHPVDTGFIDALKTGLPDCSGIAIGMDRLQMMFANAESIEETKLLSVG